MDLVWRDSLDSLAFSPDGRTIATVGYARDQDSSPGWTVRLWDVTRNKVRKELDRSEEMHGLSYSADGKAIATAARRSD
ncbi:hypothetical protein [Streptomyces parvus]|uniref:hypothetical protein n=1 Tax=Streptomyces parvus TaxID=66428 RepID=UPI0036393C81